MIATAESADCISRRIAKEALAKRGSSTRGGRRVRFSATKKEGGSTLNGEISNK